MEKPDLAVEHGAPATPAVPRARPPRPAGDVLAARLESITGELEKNAAKIREKSDPDALHDLRVASRRLRAALALAGEIASRKRERRLRRELRRLGRALGEMREADVNAALLREESFAGEPAREAAREALLASVIAEARRLRRQVLKRLKKTDIPRLGKELRAFAESLRSQDKGGASLAGFARIQIETAREPVLQLRETSILRPTPQNLHLLRIAAKKFRYAVELLSAAFDSRRGSRIRKRLKTLQDLLGRYHDLVVLHSEIRRRRSRLRADGLALLDRETGALQRRVAKEMSEFRGTLVRKIARDDLGRFLESLPQALKPEPAAEVVTP